MSKYALTIPFRVASSIPGRVRIKYTAAQNSEFVVRSAVERLSRLPYVAQTEIIEDARSIILKYSPSCATPHEVLRDVDHALNAYHDPAGRNGKPRDRARRNGHSAVVIDGRYPVGLSVLHAIPGRLRLQLDRLHFTRGTSDRLHQQVSQQEGINSVEVEPDSGSLIVRYDPGVLHPAGVVRLVRRMLRLSTKQARSPSEVLRARDFLEEEPPEINPLVVPSVAVGLAAVSSIPPLLAGVGLAAAALPILARAFQGIRQRRFNVDQLDLAALIVLAFLGDFWVASIMTWLVGLGEYIRERTVRRSRRAISEMMSPATQQAWIERGGSLVSVPVESLQAGDVVHVYPGDQIPVDGKILSGEGLVDQKTLTGESAPVRKRVGDTVLALTSLTDGQISVEVEHIGRETRAGRVVEMIEDAPLSDTGIQNYASKVGDRMVGPIFGLGIATYLVTGDPFRLAAVLILDLATGIRVSAPTTVLSAMTGAAKHGLFIKGGKALEKLATVDAVVFDKTGTLTRGEPIVATVKCFDPGLSQEDALCFAASAEANLKHPSARAVVAEAAARGLDCEPATDVSYTLGMGIKARVNGRVVHVGSERFVEEAGANISAADAVAAREYTKGRSVICVLIDEKLAALISYADPPRPESALVIKSLRDRRIRRIIMLSGDNSRAAESVAAELGIKDVVADVFPEQKAAVVRRLREEGHVVAVVGDGINDSPAFASADVSISMQHGADVAKETADVILLDGDLRALPQAIDLSREAMGVLRQNINIVVGPTLLGIAASVVGAANPLVSTLINNGTAVLAGLNALRPLFWSGSEMRRVTPLASRECEYTRDGEGTAPAGRAPAGQAA